MGLASFSAASAQEKDLFDIQQYLQKKQADTKKNNEQFHLVMPPLNPAVSSPPYTTSTWSLPNGDKVVILGQDNMPCVVPDMSLFHAMPNVNQRGNRYLDLLAPFSVPGQIPNGAFPVRMIVAGKK
ncbi:MAG: hypothetical protein ABI688_10245 [Bacteroidota bacterium]